MALKDYITLMRPKQWYKNLLVFLPLIFAQEFYAMPLMKTVEGFFALCLASSFNYILNDIIDRKRDRINAEKRYRPIASNRVSVWQAIILALILILGVGYLSMQLSPIFSIFMATFVVLTQLYSFMLKNKIFADVLLISVNFVLRAISGAWVISNGTHPYIAFSAWLILCPFFLALFLAVSKRRSETIFLKEKATEHRSVLQIYTPSITSALMQISTVLFISSYALFTFFSAYKSLLFSLPFVLYIIFQFFQMAEQGSIVVRHPELIYKEKELVIPAIIILIIVALSIYFGDLGNKTQFIF